MPFEPITFWVSGVPQPGGSKRAFVNKKTGRAIITEDCKRNKGWRSMVADAARPVAPTVPIMEPVEMHITFVMPRPKGHFGSGKNAATLKPSAPWGHTVKPDATKLVRSTEDALTGILWHDDAQIVVQVIRKIYGPQPGASVTICMPTLDQLRRMLEAK